MNAAILDELIHLYEENIDTLYGSEHDEIFKWRALKTFQREWFRNDHPDFASRFNAATKDFSVLIDNSRMHPRNAVVKLYEKDSAEVERLFCDVLFAEDHGDLKLRQEHMDQFLDGMERLRIAYYPGSWSFKHDRHAASAYLAMYAPEDNYIYKYSEAAQMAAYGEYGFDIGSGGSFDLSKYYQMCDEIVERLKAHPEFLRKHFDKLRRDGYCAEERSLHLLAFDLIYCCRTYGYYKEIPYVPKAKSQKRKKAAEQQEADAAARQARIADITAQIEDLRASLPDVSDISLVNVAVTSRLYGGGMVTEHNLNTIRVRFPGATKTFILDAKFPQRPTFENDADVVAAYTEYTSISGKIEKLEKQLKKLREPWEYEVVVNQIFTLPLVEND